jgi:O-antigen/teichoic acid export membrane protein
VPLHFPTVARDIGRLLGVNVLMRLVGIAALVVYARQLPPLELAALPVFFILGSFVTVPLSFGLFPTLMREVPVLLEQDRPAALGTIRTVALTVSGGIALTALAYLVFAPSVARMFFGSADWTWAIYWMIPGAIARGLDDITTFVLRSTREFGALAQKKLVAECTTPVATVALIHWFGLRGLILGLTLGVVAGFAWAMFRAWRFLAARAKAVPLIPLVKRSRPYYVEGALFFVTQQGDQALVAALLSPVALTSYYIARRIPDALASILLAIEEVMGPTLARASLDGPSDLRRMFQRLTVTVAAFVLPAGALAASLAPAYTKLVGAGTYAGITFAVAILTLGVIAQGAITVISQSALALGHPRDRLKVTTTLAIALLGFTAISAPLGLSAVAVGRVAALVLAALLGARLLRHLLPPLPWRELSRLVVPTALLAGTAVALQQLSDSLWLVPAFGAASIGVFVAALFALLGPADRQRLAALWQNG